jgi:hypothetical protein
MIHIKLAQLLSQRADMRKTITSLVTRIHNNLLVQEGETTPEDPDKLVAEYEALQLEWTKLVNRINAINVETQFDGEIVGKTYNNLSEVIVERDRLRNVVNLFRRILEGSVVKFDRFSRNEIKQSVVMNVTDIRKRHDTAARDLRTIDDKLQEINWSIDVE